MFRTLVSRIATGPILRTSPAASARGIEPINFRNQTEAEQAAPNLRVIHTRSYQYNGPGLQPSRYIYNSVERVGPYT